MPRGPARLRTDDQKKNQIGDRMRELREAADLTQDAISGQIAEATRGQWAPDLHEIYRIESGRRSVTTLELVVISDVLKCDACWLLFGTKSVDKQQPGALRD
jgi:transcriptional regulator with XRE-family HTH domain